MPNRFDKLRFISLRHTKITAAGCLKLNLRTLELVEVERGFMPEATAEQLRKQLPRLSVNYYSAYDDDLPWAPTYWKR